MRVNYLIIFLLTSFFSSCNLNKNTAGKALYELHCANCHMESGQGLKGLIPPLTDTEFLKTNRSKLPCWIKFGMDDIIEVNGKEYAEPMPGIVTLTEAEITNIINYIQTSWHDEIDYYSPIEVQQSLKECE